MNRLGFNDHLNVDQAKKIVKEVIKNNKSGEFFISSSNFYLVLQRTAINLGYIEDPQSIHTNILSRNDEIKCIDELWNYVLTGILSPGSNQNYSDSKFFPHLHLTELGKHVIENQDYDPYSSESYLNHLMEINSDLVDDAVKTFLLEALRSFKLNCYFGSIALLGMCAETIFMHFVDEMRKFVKIDMSHTITTTFKNLLESIVPLKNKLPSNIGQNLELWLSEFFNYIRQTRNELHQPIVNSFSREDVYG
ncbi:unnamed protein product, partial [marine sediment metagenome]